MADQRPQRTYHHLTGARRRPDDYDIVSTGLLYYPALGFSVSTPSSRWHAEQQAQSGLQRDLSAFADPRRETYETWVSTRAERDRYIDALLADAGDDGELSDGWLDAAYAPLVAPLRYPCHALHMLAAQVAHLAPTSQLVIMGLFHAGDEMRRVHRLAYRLAMLRRRRPDLGDDARAVWEQAPHWQPLRRLVERLLATRDWAEAWIVLHCALKPRLDALLDTELARVASDRGDQVLARLLRAFAADTRWHHDAHGGAFARFCVDGDPATRDRVDGWIAGWRGPVDEALRPLVALVGALGGGDPALISARISGYAASVTAKLSGGKGDE